MSRCAVAISRLHFHSPQQHNPLRLCDHPPTTVTTHHHPSSLLTITTHHHQLDHHPPSPTTVTIHHHPPSLLTITTHHHCSPPPSDTQSRLFLLQGDGFRHQALVNQTANQTANQHSPPQAPLPITVILFIQLAEEPLQHLLLQSLAMLPTQGVTIVSATRFPPSLLETHNEHVGEGVEGGGHAVSLRSSVMDVSTTWSPHLPLYVYQASPITS